MPSSVDSYRAHTSAAHLGSASHLRTKLNPQQNLVRGIIILWSLVLVAVACTPGRSAAPANPGHPSIALVLPGAKDDNSWSAAAYQALQAVAAEGSRTAVAERVDAAAASQVLQSYIDQGFQIIIAHSYSYQDAVFAVAEAYPEVYFAWAGGIGRTARNVADYDQPFYEAAYLAGILAGSMSQSGKLGALYAFAIPACHAMGEAFLAGATSINPTVDLLVAETGDWDNVAQATTAALEQADQQNVDFWIACGEGPTLGTIAAARATGGWATGYASDMADLAPDVVLASMVWQMTPLFQTLTQTTAQGAFQGAFYRLGFKEGAIDLVINPALQGRIPTAAQQTLAQAKVALQQGTLRVPYLPR